MLNRIKKICICSTLAVFVLLSQGCSQSVNDKNNGGISKAQYSYASSLKWKNIYGLSTHQTVGKEEIDVELGKITKRVEAMPKLDGEINDTQYFKPGDTIYSLKKIETSEAIAVKKDHQYYRLDRSRSSLGIVWDNKVYDFQGNFDNENEIGNQGDEVGKVSRIIKGDDPLENGCITVNGVEVDLTYFPAGSKIYKLKNGSLNEGILVVDKNGKFQKAVYIKTLK